MTGAFLLEIGTEEIPAGFLPKALSGLQSLVAGKLSDFRLEHGEIQVMGTPRRLACLVAGVSLTQEDEEKVVFGPPTQAAFDKDGAPTKAAQGFARAHGLNASDLAVEKTAKGEVVCVRKTIKGRDTIELLSETLPALITSIPFPKSMRWGSSSISFARPIHWILALLDETVIPFELGDIKSSNQTCGHRFMAPESFAVKNADDYLKKLEKAYVIVDPKQRSLKTKQEIADACKTVNGKILDDPELVEENTNLVEYPNAVCGSFEPRFLQLPGQALITAMREHQRYFAVLDGKGALMPNFVAVNNTLARNPDVVRSGHERVLRARLEDARFFFEEDTRIALGEHAERLKKVLFQVKLGTSYEKMERFKQLAAFIAARVCPESVDDVTRCAELCKADLVTEMVGEFPSLQGTMGKVYARISGEKEAVAEGIEESYLPRFSGDVTPSGTVGAVVGVADRLDTIAGCFGIGLIPTGAADPYALRRHTLAIINILLDKNWNVSLRDLINESLRLLQEKIERSAGEVANEALEFFRVRLRGIFGDKGFSHDVLGAALDGYMDRIPDALRRVEAVARWRSDPDSENQATTFKRVFNIIKDQLTAGEVDSGVFQTLEEAQLYGAYQTTGKEVEAFVEKQDYAQALNALFGLKEPIDNFFEAVMVMDEDKQVRLNRLNLLAKLAALFRTVADFSKLEI